MIGKFDCRVFWHINSLGDKISNTAAIIQPNPFGFGKIHVYRFRNLNSSEKMFGVAKMAFFDTLVIKRTIKDLDHVLFIITVSTC